MVGGMRFRVFDRGYRVSEVIGAASRARGSGRWWRRSALHQGWSVHVERSLMEARPGTSWRPRASLPLETRVRQQPPAKQQPTSNSAPATTHQRTNPRGSQGLEEEKPRNLDPATLVQPQVCKPSDTAEPIPDHALSPILLAGRDGLSNTSISAFKVAPFGTVNGSDRDNIWRGIEVWTRLVIDSSSAQLHSSPTKIPANPISSRGEVELLMICRWCQQAEALMNDELLAALLLLGTGC